METFVAKLVPVLVTVLILAVIMLLMTAIGWASGKFIRKILGIGGK